MAEMEETVVGPISLTVNHLLDILVCKELEHKGNVVGVEKQLAQILEFKYVLNQSDLSGQSMNGW
jgi:hypothetical protein